MPISVDIKNPTGGANMLPPLSFEKISYDYPGDPKLDLEPGSELHQMLVSEIVRRAEEASRLIGQQVGRWREIDDVLRVYVRPDQGSRQTRSDRKKSQHDDGLEPKDDTPRIIMPVSYANMETSLTYLSMALLVPPIFRYNGVGPEDMLGAQLLQLIVEQQTRRNGFSLVAHTAMRDMLAYGFGAVHPRWKKEFGYRTVLQEQSFFSGLFRGRTSTGFSRVREFMMTYEGNVAENLDPYRLLPDPNVPIDKVQEGQFIGWLDRTNLMELLGEEMNEEDGMLFNVKYISQLTNGRSRFVEGRGHERRDSNAGNRITSNDPVDVIWMYITLIPSMWKLSDSDRPEKWLFGVAADSVLIAAQPLGLDHNQYPISVGAPEYDGYSVLPVGRMELISSLQTLVDFLQTSHVSNVRKALNDMFLVDPSLVNVFDLMDPRPGKIIRTRKPMWGKGDLKQAIQQLPVNDVTRQNVEEAMQLANFTHDSTGIPEALRGVVHSRGPRVSASQAQGAQSAGLVRMEKMAMIIAQQFLHPIGFQFASNTQQLMEETQYVRVIGELAERLKEDFGGEELEIERERLQVKPDSLIVDFDLEVSTASVPGSENPELWTELFQMAAASQNPEIAQRLDFLRVFKHIARQLGARNVDDFVKPMPKPVLMADDTALREVEAGNLIPAGGDGQTSGLPQVGL